MNISLRTAEALRVKKMTCTWTTRKIVVCGIDGQSLLTVPMRGDLSEMGIVKFKFTLCFNAEVLFYLIVDIVV